ncbi:MAG: hypothetical protein L0Y62_07835 [Nitrospirae bacterium]|nr:hypothetical protein [Nitrospirota bacterium]
MCKLIRKVICLALIASVLFFGITLWGLGGEKFRQFGDEADKALNDWTADSPSWLKWIGKKIGGTLKNVGEKLGKEADETANSIKETFDRWSGVKGRKPIKDK